MSENLLNRLELISTSREDGGLLHSGYVHFIQQRLSDELSSEEGGFDMVLKAGIYGVLERVPDKIPEDLPSRFRAAEAAGDDFEPEQPIWDALNEVNKGLILPLSGYEMIRIIELAKEYELGDPSGSA